MIKEGKTNVREIADGDYYDLNGIAGEVSLAKGSIKLDLLFDGNIIKHNLYVVEDNINIMTDGILGRDFLQIYNCKIDYETCVLVILCNDDEIVLPMNMNI